MMLHDQVAAQMLFTKLQPPDFILVRHQLIFKTVCQLIRENRPTDLETVYRTLAQSNTLNQVGGLDYLTTINEHYLTVARLDDYLCILIDSAKTRKLQQLVNHVTQAIKDQTPIAVLLNETETKLLQISTAYTSGAFQSLGQELMTVWANMEQLAHTERGMSGVGSGVGGLDNMTLGFQKGDFIILAGRPSMGKTALAVSFMLHAAVQERQRIAMISLEMPLVHLVERMLSVEAKVDLMKVKSPVDLGAEEWEKLKQAKARLAQAKILLKADVTTLDQVQSQVLNLHRQSPIDLLVVDYLQLISVPKLGSRQEEVASISQTLKQLARRLKIPIICLSQLSRGVERREEKRPLMSDLRDSGAIEQDADLVMFVYRPDYYQKPSEVRPENQEVELIVSKHRNGPIGNVQLRFSLKCGEFIEIN